MHFQAHGRGTPVVFVHGWLGSWDLWRPTMEALAWTHRCYALDLWGFGESGKRSATAMVSNYIDLVAQFLDALGIERAAVIGHSMGGTTALGAAIRYPERVSRVGVIGSPIVGRSLALLLQLAGVGWIGRATRLLPGALPLGLQLAAPVITRGHRIWAPMVVRDVGRTTPESFFSSIGSLRRTDLRPQLERIRVPTLGVYGQRDVIVHPHQYKPLAAGVPQARIEILPRSGHFPMLDEPDVHLAILRSFLSEGAARTVRVEAGSLENTAQTHG